MVSIPQYPLFLQHVAQANILFESGTCDMPVNKRQRLSPLAQLRRLLGHLDHQVPQILPLMQQEKSVLDHYSKMDAAIKEFVHGSPQSASAHTSPALDWFLSKLDQVERSTLISVPEPSALDSWSLIQHLLWVDLNNRGTMHITVTAEPRCLALHHMCLTFLDPLLQIHRNDFQMKDNQNKVRLDVILTTIKSVLCPFGKPGPSTDVRLCSMRILKPIMVGSATKLPANTIDFIRPRLQEFANGQITLQLLDALSRAADVLPSLFSQVFVRRSVEVLQALAKHEQPWSQGPDCGQKFIVALQTLCKIARTAKPDATVFPGLCDAIQSLITSQSCDEQTSTDVMQMFLQYLSQLSLENLTHLKECPALSQLRQKLRVYAPFNDLLCETNLVTQHTGDHHTKRLPTFYRNPAKSDITLLCRTTDVNGATIEHTVPANKTILELHCPYFDTLFSSGLPDACRETLSIDVMDMDAFETCYKFIHGITELPSTDHALLAVIRQSDFLGLNDLTRLCERALTPMVNPNNLKDIISDPVILSSPCWQQISSLHLSPLAMQCRECVLELIHLTHIVDFDNVFIRDLICHGFR